MTRVLSGGALSVPAENRETTRNRSNSRGSSPPQPPPPSPWSVTASRWPRALAVTAARRLGALRRWWVCTTSAPASATDSRGATGCAGWPRHRSHGRSTRTTSPPRSLTTCGCLPKVTSSHSTSRASALASSSGYRSPPPNSPAAPNAAGATCMTRTLSISLVTLGDPDTLTGGYLYHRRMQELAPANGARLEFVSLPARPFPLPALAGRRALRAIVEQGADVVVVDSIAASFLAPWVRSLAVPMVGSLHQPPGGIDHRLPRRTLQAPLDRVTYRRAAHLLVASDLLAGQLAAQGFADRLTVVPPGRDVAQSPGGAPLDLREGAKIALLCVGNWVPRKGILELLEAVARLPPGTVRLHLAGDEQADPAYAARVRRRLARLDVATRVVRHGLSARGE